MNILITGATGFVGGYLIQALLEQPNARLYALVRTCTKLLPEHQNNVICLEGDLLDTKFVEEALADVRPDVIYHLAGQASEPESWANPWQTYQTNLLIQLNLFNGILALGLNSKMLCVTSGKVYGAVPEAEMPITESADLCPNNPYGVSKATQDMMARQYFLSHSLHSISARPFNHIGPRQTPEFVTASFAQQIALVEAGQAKPVIRVGNLAAKRDFTDVRDVIDAYLLLMEHGTPGEAYNIGSGQAISIQKILDIFLDF